MTGRFMESTTSGHSQRRTEAVLAASPTVVLLQLFVVSQNQAARAGVPVLTPRGTDEKCPKTTGPGESAVDYFARWRSGYDLRL